MFRELGTDAWKLLGAIAFFPQGVDEKNIEWLFPKSSNGPNMLDTFCILSLTYRSNRFVTMFAPLIPKILYHLPSSTRPRNVITLSWQPYHILVAPISKNRCGSRQRMLAFNIEHLLDVFASVDVESESFWRAYSRFLY